MSSACDLACEILKKTGKPMHYREITEEILKIRSFSGKTPEYSILSMMLTDKKKRFVRVARGTYAIRK